MLRFKLKNTILIVLGLTVLLALAAYVLLPFWLPTGAIRDKIAQRLQSRLGREVSIGNLTVGWSGGTVISDVRVRRRQEFSPGVLIRIGRIRCPLEPFSILRGEIPELRIEDTDLFVIVDKDGRTNIGDLPAMDIAIGRILIEQSKLHLLYPWRQATKEQVFNIDSAQIHQDREENRINLSFSARLPVPADNQMRADLQAQYFPVTGVFQIEQTRVTGDGLNFDLAGRYDPCAADGNLFRMSLTNGQLEPQHLSALLERFAAPNQQLRKAAPPDACRLTFNADLDVTSKGAVLTAHIDGSEWALRSRHLRKKPGEPLCLDLACRFDRDNASFGIDRMTALFKSVRAECRLTDLKLPGSQNIRFSDWLGAQANAFISGSEKTALRARINLGDLRDLRSINGLEKLPNGWRLTGPAYIELDLSPEKDRISYARLVLPEKSRCVIKNNAADDKINFVKKPDQMLEIKLSADRGQTDPKIETLRLETRIGEGGFDFGPVSLTFRNRREFALDGEWQLTNAQEWLSALPALEQTLQKNKIIIAGDCEGSVTVSEAADRPSRWIGEIDARKLFFQIGSGDQAIQANDFRSRPFLRKEPGRRGRLRLELLETDDDGTIAYRGTVKLDEITALLTGKTTLPAPNRNDWPWIPRELHLRIDSGNLKKLPRLAPRLFDREKHISLGHYRIADLCGAGQLNLTLINKNNPEISVQSNSGQDWDVEFSLEASPVGFALKSSGARKKDPTPDNDLITDNLIILKRKDVPLRVQGRASLNQPSAIISPLSPGTGTQTGEITLAIAGLDWRMADSEGSLAGRLNWKPNGPRLFPSNLGQSFNRIELDIRTRLDHNDQWLRELPVAEPWYDKLGLSGQTTVESRLNWDHSRELFACEGNIDFTVTGGHIDLTDENEQGTQLKLTKPIGDTLKADFDLASKDNGSTLRVRRLRFELPDTVIDCNAVLENANLIAFYQGKQEHLSEIQKGATQTEYPAERAVFAVTLDANNVEQLTPWLEIKSATRDRSGTDEKDPLALFLQTIKGRLHTSAQGLLTFSPSFDWRLRQSRIDGDIRALWLDTPIELSLRDIAVSNTGFSAPAITINAGQSRMTLIAELEGSILSGTVEPDQPITADMPSVLPALSAPRGRIDILAQRIDVDELTALLSMPRQISRQGDSVNQPPVSAETVDRILGFLTRCELNGSARIDKYSYTDPHGQSRLQPDELRCRYQLRQGLAHVTYLTALNGGVISGEMNCDFNDPNGTIRHHRTSRSIGISEAIRPIVESEFPGLIVNGTISEDYELTCDLRCLLDRPTSPAAPLPEQLCGFAGTGTTVLTDGLLYGPGGPGWLMSVFPGLKLVEYEWEKMTNRYESFPDGRKKNTMLFNGRDYDIYIEGASGPVRDHRKYQQVMALLERDQQQAKKRFNALQRGELKLSFRKRQRLEQRLRGLELLLGRHRQGRLLSVSEADYIAGGILCSGGKKLFEKPREILRIPFFRSQSYIIGRHMIGTKTTNIPLNRL